MNKDIQDVDEIIAQLISAEGNRQQNCIELIASENFTSRAVMNAQGSILTNKYAEGYPDARYYGGCHVVDKIEKIAIDRVKKLFSVSYANVQPHSGSQANQAVFAALLSPYDTILGMSLDAGGHLTHGSKVNLSGKWFNAASYGVDKETGMINLEDVRNIALNVMPKLIIAGGSAYSRMIDFSRFASIAKEVGAYLMVDMAHFAGLVAGGVIDNPCNYADVITSTTHKTLRGPRGGIILTNNKEIADKIDKAVFPGVQGGPLMHVIAAKAVAFLEALQPSFSQYCKQILLNAKALSNQITQRGYRVFTGGTDNHLVLLDLRCKNLTGKDVQYCLGDVGITCNKNSIPFDTQKPSITSGIRVGTAAGTTRGFKEEEFLEIGNMICDVLDSMLAGNRLIRELASGSNMQGIAQNRSVLNVREDSSTGTTLQVPAEVELPKKSNTEYGNVRERVAALCHKFPIYQDTI